MTPMLMFGFGLPASTAVGTDLLFATFTQGGALHAYAKDRCVDWSVAGAMLLGSLPAVVIAMLLLAWVDTLHDSEQIVRVAIGGALLFTALHLLKVKDRSPVRRQLTGFTKITWLRGGGALIGVLVAMTSIGAGSLGMALLTRLYPERKLRVTVGTELAHAVPLAAIATGGHLLLNQVDWRVALDLAIGAVPGIWIGRRLVPHLPEKWLRLFLALFLAGTATKLIA